MLDKGQWSWAKNLTFNLKFKNFSALQPVTPKRFEVISAATIVRL
jgi:hypothetical protein